MYFISVGGRLYRWAVSINPWYRYGITVITCACMSLLFFAGFHSLEDRITQRTKHLEQFYKRKQEAAQLAQELSTLEEQNQLLQNHLTRTTPQGTHHDTFQEQVDSLLKQVHKHQLTLKRLESDQPYCKGPWCKKKCCTLQLNGSMTQIINMLKSIEHDPTVSVTQLNLETAQNNNYTLTLQTKFNVMDAKFKPFNQEAEGLGG